MELTFEHSQKVVDGQNPAGYHTPDNFFQVLFTDGSEQLQGTYTPTPYGVFSDREFETPYAICPDEENVQLLRLNYLPRINLFVNWESDDRHRLTILILKQDVSKYLDSGRITYKEDNPVASLTLALENPEGIFAAEGFAAVGPGSRISIWFSMGDSRRIRIGEFYLDKIKMGVTDPLVNIDARNSVGKLLKDQTFDENYIRGAGDTAEFFGAILAEAGIRRYSIQSAVLGAAGESYEFSPDKSYFDGIREVLDGLIGWKMRENPNGEIIIGHADYDRFTEGIFSFSRGEDCFSRNVVREDKNSYSRIAVYSKSTWIESDTYVDVVGEELGAGPDYEFMTEYAPVIFESVTIYVDGVPLSPEDYNITAWGEITLFVVPATGDPVTIDYHAEKKKMTKSCGVLGDAGGEDYIGNTHGRPIAPETVDVYIVTSSYGKISLTELEGTPEGTGAYYDLDLETGDITIYNQWLKDNPDWEMFRGLHYVTFATDTIGYFEQEETFYVYRDVDFPAGWNLPRKKTLYIRLPENVPLTQLEMVADSLAEAYSQAGTQETFLSPFRPQVQPGDEASISEPGKLARVIGNVIQVEHEFSRRGFFTQFTVDSSGVIGKASIKTYIEELAQRLLKDKVKVYETS